jgi:hypothetical protein
VGFIIRLDTIDRVMVLESVESIGVRTVPLSHYVYNYKGDGKGYPGKLLIARHDHFDNVPKQRMHKMSQFAVDHFGYPYDKDEIMRIAGRIGWEFLGFLKKEVERDVERDKEFICSEYAWECYKEVGIVIPYDERGFVAPKDFALAKEVNPVGVIEVKSQE